MNHVTFETAKALKDAGFRQPEPEVGQFWYSGSGVVNVCRYIWRSTRGFFSTPPRFVGLGYHDPLLGTLSISESFFAPTATDILEVIGDAKWGIIKNGDWQIVDMDDVIFNSESGFKNPAEAAAQLWLKLNPK